MNLDVIGYDLTANAASHVGNISTRSFVQTADDVMIGGFIIEGGEPKTLFSSRRRHTIFSRDWSSDVCSSDLEESTNLSAGIVLTPAADTLVTLDWYSIEVRHRIGISQQFNVTQADINKLPDLAYVGPGGKIGRASCRERV